MDKFDQNKHQQAPSQSPSDKNKYDTQRPDQQKQGQTGKRVDDTKTDRNKVTTPGQSGR